MVYDLVTQEHLNPTSGPNPLSSQEDYTLYWNFGRLGWHWPCLLVISPAYIKKKMVLSLTNMVKELSKNLTTYTRLFLLGEQWQTWKKCTLSSQCRGIPLQNKITRQWGKDIPLLWLGILINSFSRKKPVVVWEKENSPQTGTIGSCGLVRVDVSL